MSLQGSGRVGVRALGDVGVGFRGLGFGVYRVWALVFGVEAVVQAQAQSSLLAMVTASQTRARRTVSRNRGQNRISSTSTPLRVPAEVYRAIPHRVPVADSRIAQPHSLLSGLGV